MIFGEPQPEQVGRKSKRKKKISKIKPIVDPKQIIIKIMELKRPKDLLVEYMSKKNYVKYYKEENINKNK